jgi:hypothetical protein
LEVLDDLLPLLVGDEAVFAKPLNIAVFHDYFG